MCGIAGILRFDEEKITRNCIKKMTDALIHRGPDGEGLWINEDQNVGFGHRRLAIIDLSDHAGQPMVCKKTGNVIVFNGEIYNYVELRNELKLKGYTFYTNSDTEVLLALYEYKKESCLEDLNGMFAFAIWDKNEQKLFCARDRFGEKPFYYYQDDKQFVFASEMKALWNYGVKKEITNEKLYDFVLSGSLSYKNGVGLYEHIKSLPPSAYLTFNLVENRILIQNYYSIDNISINKTIKFDLACRMFFDYFKDSVRIRLRSDVPVGSSFSGGLDSSSIVAIVQHLSANSKSFSFSARFENFTKDEGYYIEQVTKRYPSIISNFVWPNEKIMMDEMPRLVYYQEEPFGSSSIYAQWCVMRLAKEHGVTVLLDGQGADEILGGYKSCVDMFFKELIFRNYFKYLKEYYQFNSRQKDSSWKIERYEKKETLRMALGRWKIYVLREYDRIPYSFNEHLKYLTSSNENLVSLLRYADRNSMAFSREVRLPFLDQRVVDFLFTLPPEYKFKNGWTKYILRKSFEGKLPSQIVWRRNKVGFETPQYRWFEYPEIKEIVKKQAEIFDCSLDNLNDNRYINTLVWRLFLSYFYLT